MVSDPELIKQILDTRFGSFADRRPPAIDVRSSFSYILPALTGRDWERMHRNYKRVFTLKNELKIVPKINDCCDKLIETWNKRITDKDNEIDIEQSLRVLILDTMAWTVFGTRVSPEFTEGTRRLTQCLLPMYLIVTLFPKLTEKISRAIKLCVHTHDKYFLDYLNREITQRDRNGSRGNDFLQLFMDLRKHNSFGEPLVQSVVDDNVIPDEDRLTEQENVWQLFTFPFWNFRSMFTALGFGLYELAVNPDIQDRLRNEINTTIGGGGDGCGDDDNASDTIDVNSLDKLVYLEAFLLEVHRKYPVFYRLSRSVSKDTVLGSTGSTTTTGIMMPKNQIVNIPVHALHHNSSHYPEPELFDPDRFMPENLSSNINPYTYLAYGIGPRQCIAKRFSQMQLKLVLCRLIRKYEFYRLIDTTVPPVYHNNPEAVTVSPIKLGIKYVA
ncbi:cytochrome P450 3A41-like [Oppia nitens]|uniref:cytochrome P450 3A41-like n=1 Tax=Oppia nitens TaxID=1686743 RepID=UPI0023DA5107|nr:cytochrome P450 3A41-like [Oppia nitens]